MSLFRACSWIAYFLAAALAVAGVVSESLVFAPMAVTAAVAGVLFAALDQIVTRLTEIRDRLPAVELSGREAFSDEAKIAQPIRTIAEITADITRMQKGRPASD